MEHRISLEDECRWVRVLIQLVKLQTAGMQPAPPWARPDYRSPPALPSGQGSSGPAAEEVPGHFFDTDDDSQEASEEVRCCAEG